MNNSSSSSQLPPRVVRWTQKLLDLSRRNRLLNIRDGREYIPLDCESVDEIEDELADGNVLSLVGDANSSLRSALTPAETEKRLIYLFRTVKTDLEESGLNTLFVAIGNLVWQEDVKNAKACRAPIILLPVRLIRKSVKDIRLEKIDEEALINPTLMELLRSQFGIRVENMDVAPTDEHGLDVAAILQAFADAVASQSGWSVERAIGLGRFSFGKFTMWKDLTSRLDTLRKSKLVSHLIDGGSAFDDGVKVFPPERINAQLHADDFYCPLSADSSQLTAVMYSALGKTFVLHGPPGTGKSQTITNLIAHNLAHGRRVLFVSEKKAALDVVHSRLSKIGLKPFLLELHSNKANKEGVIAQFRETLALKLQREDGKRKLVADRLERVSHDLWEYVDALHKKYPNGLSAYDCMAMRIADAHAADSPASTADSSLIWRDTLHETAEAREHARDLAIKLANDLEPLPPGALDALAPVKDAQWTPEFERSLAAAANKIASGGNFLSKFFSAFGSRSLIDFKVARKLSAEDAKALAENVPNIRAAFRYRATRAEAVAKGLEHFAEALEKRRSDPENERNSMESEQIGELFNHAHAARMLDEIFGAEPALANFNVLDHEAKVKRFAELDDSLCELAKNAVFTKLCERLPMVLNGKASKNSELGILRRECEKKMRHKPVRQLLREIPTLAPALKPCFLMSPLSVAQYLPPDTPPFDLVVFDEASQIPVWEAIGAIARGRQLVVVGDPKQMPPTNFFQKADAEDVVEDENEEAVIEDAESILDECLAAGVPSAYLNWHYRSRHESLISFSNHNYYDDRLFTFPAAESSDRLGVQFKFVADGVYDRKASRTNKKEAQALVDWLFERISAPDYQPRTVGVVTFSEAQRDLIENLIDERRSETPETESFFAEEAEDPFFVKNLENVQGDERDVILFSVGYAKDATGNFAMNFGPLNRTGGERRLNVAVTRAKEQIVVFASIHGTDIDLNRTSAVGAAHLRSFLEFAEAGGVSVLSKAGGSDQFATAVAEFIRGHGYEVEERVGNGACRIDLVVHRPGETRPLLAIECDGVDYSAQNTVRDRDKLRHSVLSSLGWRIVRIWAADWTLNRLRAEKKLLDLLAAAEAETAETTEAETTESEATEATEEETTK